MKIDINKIKVVHKNLSNKFELCVFGNPTDEIIEWILINRLKISKNGNYTNIILPTNINLTDIFLKHTKFTWMDGFSPNLNKKLHIGHFSNLVLAKAFKSLQICEKTVSIYGDTLPGDFTKKEAILLLKKYQQQFNFIPEKEVMASEVKCRENLLIDGTGEYLNTKIFKINKNKIVGIKSNGQTSYFYQDVALAEILNAKTLYLTGIEQSNHFDMLKQMFPNIKHIGLGLVKISGKKMSSRTKNVILIEGFINQIKQNFDNNTKLIYNVFAGFILKSDPKVDKNINLDTINNSKNSAGLYISYTMARLNSAGCKLIYTQKFNSLYLHFAELKAKINLKPNVLFNAIVEHCKEINTLYVKHNIKENKNNKKMFNLMLNDLILGCNKLGLFVINKV